MLRRARRGDERAFALIVRQYETPLYNYEIQPGSSDDIHFLSRFYDRLQGLMRGVVSGYAQAPSDVQREEMATVRKELEAHLQAVNQFLNTDVAAFNKLAIEHGASTLFAGLPIELKSGRQTAVGGGN